MKIFSFFLFLFFSSLIFSQQADSIVDEYFHLEELDSNSEKEGFGHVISLGQLVLDFEYNYHYTGPDDLDLLRFAHPRMGITKFVDGFMYSLFINPKYLPTSISTSLSFTVNEDGGLGNFMLGEEVNENDTLFVETLLEMGTWIPSKEGKQNTFKLKIYSKDRVQDRDAHFPGGLMAFQKYLKNNIIIPRSTPRIFEDGLVMVEFFVETDGSITGAKIIKGIGPAYDREALRIIRNMPKWIPGTQDGIQLRKRVEQGVIFEINLKQKRIKN